MKRTSIFYFSLAAIATGSLASCQDYEPFDEDAVREATIDREFTKNFEARYGKIDPNHDWGFGNLRAAVFSGLSTRAEFPDTSGAGTVYVKTNQWADESGKNNPGQEYVAGYVSIPGYPNFDGYYYSNDGNNNGLSSSLDMRTTPTTANGLRPCGDVTDYEIQYVSEYFRSTPNPPSISLHLTDFFVQPVSVEHDRVSYPDGAIKTQILGENCDFSMNRLMFKTMDSHDAVDDTWTHINNFNRNTQNKLDNYDPNYKSGSGLYVNDTSSGDVTNSTDFREIKYVTSSGTEDFAYQSNWSDVDNTYYKDWKLVKLDWDEVGQDGETHHREGYYLAFDFKGQKYQNGELETYEPDGYYSNWIIKITPAFASSIDPECTRRIMCEDLGNTLDFDFNDVVFDVYYEGSDAVITLQAAGGTLPIKVGSTGEKYEAHYLLGQEDANHNPITSTPVNVGPKGKTHAVAIYRIPANGDTNPDNIPIYVNTGTNTTTITLKTAANKTSAPQKFCAPIGVRWMLENEQIEDGYKYFDNWVGNMNYKDPENGLPWYANANVKNASLLTTLDSGVTTGEYEYDHSHNGQVTPAAIVVDRTDLSNNYDFIANGKVEAGKSYKIQVEFSGYNTYAAFTNGNDQIQHHDAGSWVFDVTIGSSFTLTGGLDNIASITIKPKN